MIDPRYAHRNTLREQIHRASCIHLSKALSVLGHSHHCSPPPLLWEQPVGFIVWKLTKVTKHENLTWDEGCRLIHPIVKNFQVISSWKSSSGSHSSNSSLRIKQLQYSNKANAHTCNKYLYVHACPHIYLTTEQRWIKIHEQKYGFCDIHNKFGHLIISKKQWSDNKIW